MNPTGRNPIRLVASIVLLLVGLGLTSFFAFSQGKAAAERRVEIHVANDSAFYCLFALRAIKEPESEKWRTMIQSGLDNTALKLSEACLQHPELIGNTNYNLLLEIQKYLNQHGHDADRNPALRPVDQITTKVAEAIAKMQSIHPDVHQWEEAESRRTETSATSK